jgi:dihydrodipicolinate synthase/N-acetylneuraminate lyase
MQTSKPTDGTAGIPRREFLQYLGAGAVGLALSASGARAQADSGAAQASAPWRQGPKELRGLFPIAQTPFTGDDKLDLDSLAAQVAFCNRGGVHGLIWPQIASGWTTLTEPERMAGAEALVAAGKGGNAAVVIGVQGADMGAVTRYAQQAAKLGADAIVSLPPANVTDEKVLLDYYQQLGKVTDLPLFVQSTGKMSVDLIVEMFKTIPTMRHVKDEAGEPLDRVAELRKRTNDQLLVFSGKGVRTLIAEMELGFWGHCPYTALADVYAASYNLWHGGRRQEAFDMFGRVLAFDSLGSTSGNDVLVARGVFKPTNTFRPIPPVPGGASGATPRISRHLSRDEVREAIDLYIKPRLTA